jgi:hypothetical protein
VTRQPPAPSTRASRTSPRIISPRSSGVASPSAASRTARARPSPSPSAAS